MYAEEIFTICSFQYGKRKSHLPLSSLKNLKDWQEEEVSVGMRQGGEWVEPETAGPTTASWPRPRPCFGGQFS